MAKPVISTDSPMASPEPNGHVSSHSTVEIRKSVRKEATFREWLVANQIGIEPLPSKEAQELCHGQWTDRNLFSIAGFSLTILTMIFAVHNLYPSLRPYTSPFLELPHYQPDKGVYFQGWDDIYFIISAMLGFTAIRAIAIDWLFYPTARNLGLKQKPAVRFAEQGWLLVYYLTFWTYGMHIWYHSKYWLNFREIWTDWPRRDIPGNFKLYCLLQLSFWLQQIFVINIEQRRKDHYQMFTHHIITSTLLGSAYFYSFYNVANVVLCIMDIVDYLLPAAKMLKYLGCETACTAAFAVFLGTWFIARHIIYMALWWSIYQNVPDAMPFGKYSGTTAEMLGGKESIGSWTHIFAPVEDLNGPIYMSPLIKTIFLSLLLALQVLSIIWFGMILRVAAHVLKHGSSAQDTRSDGEDEEEDEKEAQENGEASDIYNNSENGRTTITYENYNSDSSWSKSVRTNGSTQRVRIRTARGRVTLSDQNDRKTLLGRIGCDKPS